uniref:Helicase ATP-binding domain-containing protein n=1 Tax=Corethron hystrix TaxID=216773 RepID=A0A7S1B478_9STRA|mmetsp:Transcript_11571/g.25328  ORF Transcript_11571/g.25328 Transcript_11571/m.25328 type:complete len:274 (+) Transcript_11571:269-1090(+)
MTSLAATLLRSSGNVAAFAPASLPKCPSAVRASHLDIDEEISNIMKDVVEDEKAAGGGEDDFFAEMQRDMYESKPRREAPSEPFRPVPMTDKEGPGKWTDAEGLDFGDQAVRVTAHPRYVEMGVPQPVTDSLSTKGIVTYTPVQAEAMRPVIEGHDVIGRSRTGTGKTLAFGIPAMTRLQKIRGEEQGEGDRRGRRPKKKPGILVLCPTRELARQVSDELGAVSKGIGIAVDVFLRGRLYGFTGSVSPQGSGHSSRYAWPHHRSSQSRESRSL